MAMPKSQSGINEELMRDYPQKDADNDKPRRPLTAYNLFFQNERKVLVLQALEKEHGSIRNLPPALIKGYLGTSRNRPHRKHHGVIGFHELTKKVSSKWKILDPSLKQEYKDLATKDRFRYNKEIKAWRERQLSDRCRQDIRRCSMEHDFKSIFSTSIDVTENSLIPCWQKQHQQQRSPSFTSAPLTPPIMVHEDYLSPVPAPPRFLDYPVVSGEIIAPDTVTVDSSISTSTNQDSDNDSDCGVWVPPPPHETNNWEGNMTQTQDLSSPLLPPPPFTNHNSNHAQTQDTTNMHPHPSKLSVIDSVNNNSSDHNNYSNHDLEMLASELDSECLSFLISLKPHHQEEQPFQQEEQCGTIDTVPL
eukprot:CAMPEP_0195292782 /NCGR_PEP_ID=MMETSP0707-20130614/10836_1 /TAXON_ID=33640 /ORGANISM="Asterionellopsis glacialis, Strain CCMP134" /LENGTH=361 /DNA_ID=CAMNT_0040353349 /DNA_START=173 /DNA_END=1261 /DNA_ORIENTATION=+